MSRAVLGLLITTLLAHRAFAADAAPVVPTACGTGPLAIQVDQLFEKHESYDVGGPAVSPFAPRYSRQMQVITVSRRSYGEARTTVPLLLDGRRVHGTAAMTMEADDHIHARGSTSCSRKRVFSITWSFDGTISEQCKIDLSVARDWTEQPAERACPADIFGMFGIYPPFRETWPASIGSEHGAVAKRESTNFKAKDITTLTVVRGAAEGAAAAPSNQQ